MADKIAEALARLETALQAKEEECAQLKRDVETAEEAQEWTAHETFKNDDSCLPVPRLEMVWWPYYSQRLERTTWQTFEVRYALVYKHVTGNFVRVPLGVTKTSGGDDTKPLEKDKHGRQIPRTPFREGVHIKNEAQQLKLPAFYILDGEVWRLDGDEILAVPGRVS